MLCVAGRILRWIPRFLLLLAHAGLTLKGESFENYRSETEEAERFDAAANAVLLAWKHRALLGQDCMENPGS